MSLASRYRTLRARSADLISLQEENFGHNLALVDDLTAFAKDKGITPTQLALAWNMAQWEGIIPLPGSTRPEGVKEALVAAEIELTAEDLSKIDKIINSHTIKGVRYSEHHQSSLNA